MAICDEGYRCEACGEDVEDLADSDLYLRYILGEVDPERLHLLPERHLRCNPTLAQFIVDPRFEPVSIDGPFAKAGLAAEFVAEEEARVTEGYRRLREVLRLGLPIPEYPLPQARLRWGGPAT